MDKRHRFEFRRARKALQDQGTWRDEDVSLLAMLIRARQKAANARKERAGKLTTLGSQAQLVAHPLLRVEREAEQDEAKYADMLLLSPAARERAGIAHKPPEGGKFGL